MTNYADQVANPKTPQDEKAKPSQIKNHAGGYVFQVDDWTHLNRFLILGNENGSYYASEREMTIKNYDVVKRCLTLDGKRTVDAIVEISGEGRAIRNTPALFALAVCSVLGDQSTKTYANKVMPQVARYSTDLFKWVDAINTLKQGRKAKGMLRAIGRWYTEKTAVQLAYQICKYPSRSVHGKKWGHRDLLRMARIAPPTSDGKPSKGGKALTLPSEDHDVLLRYAVHGVTSDEELAERSKVADETGKAQEKKGLSIIQLEGLKDSALKYVWAHEACKKATNVSDAVKIITDFNVTRESVEPSWRNDKDIQAALLPGMPIGALIRNLGGMTASGLLKPLADDTTFVIDKITNKEVLQKARIHPMALLIALKVYRSGKGMRTSWNPVDHIADALEEAFYASFKYVEPTGKKYLLGIDVSGSMDWDNISESVPMTSREAAAAVAMTIARTEKNHQLMAFAHDFVKLNVTAKDKLSTVVSKTSQIPMGATDCALPMRYALKHKLDVDIFVVLTDNETGSARYLGGCNQHPFEALKEYRKAFNPNAKLAVLAFTSTKFSIADPSDAGMLDIAGLDANVPRILTDFVNGKV